jgi:uncharacterized protein (DUF362 family)
MNKPLGWTMSKAKVAVVKGKEPKSMVYKALGLIGAGKEVSTDDTVLLKPNYVFPKEPSTGVTTDTRVVEAIIEFLIEKGIQKIVVADGGHRETEKTFALTGINDVASRHDVRVVNINKEEGMEVKIPSARALHRVKISKTVLESNFIVNIPTLKIHHMAQVTLSIKNLMGSIVGDKGQIMHRKIDDKLVDLASFLRPRLNVIDGIVGSEMDEVLGHPVPMNVIIAGKDIVATDAVGSAVMGVNPPSVRHIKQAELRGLGTASLDSISVLGELIETVRKNFRRGFSKTRLKEYGFDQDVGEEVLRPLWERMSSKLPE